MDGFRVDTAVLAGTAGGVTDVGTSLNTEIGRMQDILGEISAGWQSSHAAPRFYQVMRAQLDEAVVLKNALLSHGSTLLSTSQQYDQNEQSLAIGGAI